MAFFRRFFSFINKPIENEYIPTHYLGHTFATKPNSDELRRAVHILTKKIKKDLEKNKLPEVYLCFENTNVLLRDGNNHSCREYDVRKIVMSCIDAKNQKMIAIFYDNNSPFIGNPANSNMLECHLCLCKNKESAKLAANQIGKLLAREYKIPKRHPIKNLQDGNVRVSRSNYEDIDYENVSKFFQQKVFGLNPTPSVGASALSTPCSSLSTFATTTGCDSGCASTIASIDIRPDDSISGIREPTIDEHEETTSVEENSSQILETTPAHSIEPIRDNSIFHNRYSVHYDQEGSDEDNEICDENTPALISLTVVDNNNSSDNYVGLKTPELQRLEQLDETNI